MLIPPKYVASDAFVDFYDFSLFTLISSQWITASQRNYRLQRKKSLNSWALPPFWHCPKLQWFLFVRAFLSCSSGLEGLCRQTAISTDKCQTLSICKRRRGGGRRGEKEEIVKNLGKVGSSTHINSGFKIWNSSICKPLKNFLIEVPWQVISSAGGNWVQSPLPNLHTNANALIPYTYYRLYSIPQ